MKVSKRPEYLWVGVNGKPSGDHALREGISIARWLHARVTAVAVAPLYEGDMGLTAVGSACQALYKDIEHALNRALDIAESQRYRIQIAAAGGDIANELIQKTASRSKEGWIVIGASSSFSIFKWLSGSALHAVASRSSTPVLVIPEGATLSGESVWIDVSTLYPPFHSPDPFESWFDEALRIACLFGPDRLILAYPADISERLLPESVQAALQHHRIDVPGSESEPPLSVDIDPLPYPHPAERTAAVHHRKPAFVITPQPIFPRQRLSIVGWHMENMLRNLPCPTIVLAVPSIGEAGST